MKLGFIGCGNMAQAMINWNFDTESRKSTGIDRNPIPTRRKNSETKR